MAQEYKLKGILSLNLSPGDKQEVEVEGIQDAKVLLVNASGKIHATGARCTHYGAPLAKGVLTTNGRLTCPWHGACFNAKTGDVEDAPALDALPIFSVTENDGGVYITGEESAIKSSRRKPNFECAMAAGAQKDHIVIIGGGSGALGTIEGLRENGYKGALTALLTDKKKLAWRDKNWYDSSSVELVEYEVNAIDFSDRTVPTRDGKKISYTKLVLATGGRPRYLLFDKEAGKSIIIIRSLFISIEVGNATASSKNPILVISIEKAPLKRSLIVGAINLKDGIKILADVLSLGVSMAPATEFLENNKAIRLEKDGSIKTDQNYNIASLNNIYAIGDITISPYYSPGGNGWDNLVVQGDPASARFVAYYYKGETVVAVASMGKDPAIVQSAELMRLGKMPPKNVLSVGAPA
ncbi:hypothetical protein B0T10DRAFT_541846 [Thelonectria olida]|uniref:Rieske domain-containing protein n=1 Tax=Thelonectria olida TaxID=1576542 RepID=A0A9P9AJ87_9HYPO|nr:hypothetical protein B0T10DRAFT_541846 [Thelonectria olida]